MQPKATIAFFGSSLVSAYWNGAATYYRGILRQLHRYGYRTSFYEPDAFGRQQHRDLDRVDYARSIVYPATAEALGRALASAEECDIIIKASGVGVFDAELEEAVLDLRSLGKLVAFWDVDAPATLDRLHRDPADPFAALVGQYDAILTYGGGPPVVRAYEALGARRCVPIYNALDTTTHHPAPPDERFAGMLGFLGNRMPDREARVEEFFFAPAIRLPDMQFVLGGNGWDDRADYLPNVRYLGHVYTHEHNAFNCSPRAVLNISRESMARYGFSPATRVFEAAGAGACLITDAWEGIEQFLAPGRECLVAHNGEDVVQLLRELDPDRARELGEAARRRVLAEHTYARRAEQLDKLLCELMSLPTHVS